MKNKKTNEKGIALDNYSLQADNLHVDVSILKSEDNFVNTYHLCIPEYGAGTKALLNNLKNSLVTDSTISSEKMFDLKFISLLKEKFSSRAETILKRELSNPDDETVSFLVGILMHEMLGLGKIEFLLSDSNLEEIVINSSEEPVWVYHKKHGWLKTDILPQSEDDIKNYASIIARRVGKQISTLNPLLDAHLVTGDRANATLIPISTKGNTLTIRRFRRDPWTAPDLIKNGTISSEAMALIWMAVQYELNIVFSGGTASGKTTMMNVCTPFIQANQRVLSLEDTRELSLPSFLHWVPLTTREANQEGKGGVSLLDLLVNSLRMRPDRVLVGEIRRQREAEVLFEAMHTGHSVFTTVHANTSEETVQRLTNPPINIPSVMLEAVHLNVVMSRNRRTGERRMLQLSEFIYEKRGESEERIRPNSVYRCDSGNNISKHSKPIRIYEELALHTGFSQQEIENELEEKKAVLDYMAGNNIHSVDDVGKLVAKYYFDKKSVLDLVKKTKANAGKSNNPKSRQARSKKTKFKK